MLKSLLLIAVITSATVTHAHPGGVDKNGGHVDKKTGKYHTHKPVKKKK